MASTSLPADIILNRTQATLGQFNVAGDSQPGTHLEIEGQTYLVLERRNRYVLRSGRYQLHKIVLYVQIHNVPVDKRLLDGQWVIGDITCQYNARSELLRCAVNPNGPCDRCSHYVPANSD